MGDSGFDGIEAYHIRSPPSARNELYNLFSSYHIIVENVIADVKDYNVCKVGLRMDVRNKLAILKTHNKCWHIASVFVNRYKVRSL